MESRKCRIVSCTSTTVAVDVAAGGHSCTLARASASACLIAGGFGVDDRSAEAATAAEAMLVETGWAD